jgi:hypothetical protein
MSWSVILHVEPYELAIGVTTPRGGCWTSPERVASAGPRIYLAYLR